MGLDLIFFQEDHLPSALRAVINPTYVPTRPVWKYKKGANKVNKNPFSSLHHFTSIDLLK